MAIDSVVRGKFRNDASIDAVIIFWKNSRHVMAIIWWELKVNNIKTMLYTFIKYKVITANIQSIWVRETAIIEY